MSDQISPIAGLPGGYPVQQVERDSKNGGFDCILRQATQKCAPDGQGSGIAFSKHAMARAQERGIALDAVLMDQLTSSVERAQAKGATNILAFDATRAFIINVPHGRVITTMSQQEMEENIFTNIDDTMLLK